MKNKLYIERQFEYTDTNGDTFAVYPELNMYKNNNLYLAIHAHDEDLGYIDSYCDITVNIETLPYLYSAIDTTYNGENIMKFLESSGLAQNTYEYLYSGFSSYPVFKFNEDKLKEMAPEFLKEYSKSYGKEINFDNTKADKKVNALNEKRKISAEYYNDKGELGWSSAAEVKASWLMEHFDFKDINQLDEFLSNGGCVPLKTFLDANHSFRTSGFEFLRMEYNTSALSIEGKIACIEIARELKGEIKISDKPLEKQSEIDDKENFMR